MFATTSEHGALPLAPIDRPRSWFVRLLYFATRKRYGLVPTAFRVVYARSTYIALLSVFIGLRIQLFLRLPKELPFLLQVFMASRAGCTFCADLWLAEAIRARVGRARFDHLQQFESAADFSEAEKAALAYAAAVDDCLRVPDDVWQRLRAHYDERACVDIVWLCAVERYYNMMALPLRVGSDGVVDRLVAETDASAKRAQ